IMELPVDLLPSDLHAGSVAHRRRRRHEFRIPQILKLASYAGLPLTISELDSLLQPIQLLSYEFDHALLHVHESRDVNEHRVMFVTLPSRSPTRAGEDEAAYRSLQRLRQ